MQLIVFQQNRQEPTPLIFTGNFLSLKNLIMRRNHFFTALLASLTTLAIVSCQKETEAPVNMSEETVTASNNSNHGHLKQTKTFTSDVASKWMAMQVRQMTAAPTAVTNVAHSRHYVYSGITLYESVVPGMPAYQSIAPQLNGLSGLPQTSPGTAYHWAASANAALALINKKLFSYASVANKASMDSLENALNAEYVIQANAEIINRSIEFGKAVAQKVWDWAETDGYNQEYAADVNIAFAYPPGVSGPQLWVPPAAWNIQTASYWKNIRPVVTGSGNNAQPIPPPAYSSDPLSDFYQMANEVNNAFQNLTQAQKDMALYWRDVPGTTTPGHYVSILKQVLENDKPMLDVAAVAYAMGGIMVFDAAISIWETKFNYNLVRPVTYIRNVIGVAGWNSFIGTPPHPEYPSAHSSLSMANAEALTIVFGNNHSFTDHTFDYMGFPSRSYNSFHAIAEEAGLSRLYGGIHYRQSIDAGLWQGRKVADNIRSKLKFLKD
jgi:hypothetical protein